MTSAACVRTRKVHAEHAVTVTVTVTMAVAAAQATLHTATVL